MDITAGQQVRAYLPDFEHYENGGQAVAVGAVVEVTASPVLPSEEADLPEAVDWRLGPWLEAAPDRPAHRVRVRLLGAWEVPRPGNGVTGGSDRPARLREVEGLPQTSPAPAAPTERADVADAPAPEGSSVEYEASYLPPHARNPGPTGWVLELEVVEELGSVWDLSS